MKKSILLSISLLVFLVESVISSGRHRHGRNAELRRVGRKKALQPTLEGSQIDTISIPGPQMNLNGLSQQGHHHKLRRKPHSANNLEKKPDIQTKPPLKKENPTIQAQSETSIEKTKDATLLKNEPSVVDSKKEDLNSLAPTESNIPKEPDEKMEQKIQSSQTVTDNQLSQEKEETSEKQVQTQSEASESVTVQPAPQEAPKEVNNGK